MNTDGIFYIQNKKEFIKIALKTYRHQFDNIPVYGEFCRLLGKTPDAVKNLHDIPFLPIEFFKSKKITQADAIASHIFTSSGTTGMQQSKHYVTDIEIYENSFTKTFNQFYGSIEDYTILALLPSYLERDGSSLIYMVNHLINESKHSESGFYLNNYTELILTLKDLEKQGRNVLLIGVTYALLDIIELETMSLPNTIIMETGGMKGRRKEMIREELHQILSKGFGVEKIHSEYGMTELLSQAYSYGDGIFECPPWMDIIIRDPEDALTILPDGKTGGINVIDLANINSCAFIATQDLGKKYPNHSFEVLGRFDHSDIRGCNLMVY